MIDKTISSNGVYKASDDNADAFAHVTVSVPPATIVKAINSNGTYDAIGNDNAYGYVAVSVSVPLPTYSSKNIASNGVYDASDDGVDAFSKIVVEVPFDSISQSVKSITTNGVYRASDDGYIGYKSVYIWCPSCPEIADGSVIISSPGYYSKFSGQFNAASNVIVEVPQAKDYLEATISEYLGKSVVSLREYVFYNSSELKYVELYGELNSIGSYAFQRCTNLSCLIIDFGSGISSRCTIYNSAFTQCDSLKTVIIRHPLGILESQIMRFNTSATVYYPFRNTPIQFSSYGGYGSIYIYPSSLVSVYQAASGWSYYADRITAYVDGVI